MAESPVILLAVEHVPNLPAELGALPLVDQPEVSIGMAGPGTGLRLPIALEEVSNTLGISVLTIITVIKTLYSDTDSLPGSGSVSA